MKKPKHEKNPNGRASPSWSNALVDDCSANLLDAEEEAVEIALLVADKDVELAAGWRWAAAAQLGFQSRLSLTQEGIDFRDRFGVGFDMHLKPLHLAR